MKYFFLVLFFLLIKVVHAFPDERFHTRLSDSLSISGIKCVGSEITVGELQGEWSDFICQHGEWLMTVDNFNRCINDVCTEAYVAPVIVKLVLLPHTITDEETYYSILPTIPVDPETRWILRRHWVKFTLSGAGEVTAKGPRP